MDQKGRRAQVMERDQKGRRSQVMERDQKGRRASDGVSEGQESPSDGA